MIIFGRKTSFISEQRLDCSCDHCNMSDTLTLQIYQNYAHIFWLPAFPLRKSGYTHCSHCKQMLDNRQMPDHIEMKYENLKKSAKTPIWMFSAAFLFILLFISMIYSSKQSFALSEEYISSPRANDIWEFKTPDGAYTLIKIAEVQEDSVLVQLNAYEINYPTKIYTLESKPFLQDTFIFSKEEIKLMFEKRQIITVKRK